MNLPSRVLIAIASFLLVTSCGDDSSTPDFDGRTDVAADAGQDETPPATVRGQVLSPVGGAYQVVAGARIWIDGGPSAVSDAAGRYALADLEAREPVLIHVAGPDWDSADQRTTDVYGTMHVWFEPTGPDENLFLTLLRGCTLSVDSAQARTVAVNGCGGAGWIEVDLPADAFVFEDDSSPHSGTVRIEMAVVDPVQGLSYAGLPPDRLEDDPDVLIDLLGGAELRFYDAITLSPLQVADGEVVVLRLPLGEPLMGADFSETTLSWYDTAEGRWVEETTAATATSGEGEFSVEVHAGHFSAVRATVSTPGPIRGCLAVWPTLETLEVTCQDDFDCPEGPNGWPRPCTAGTCGCSRDDHCANDMSCNSSRKRCEPAPCDASTPCRLGIDRRELRCDADTATCGCSDSRQCPGDLQCVEGSCRQLNADAEVLIEGRFWRRFHGLRGCRIVPHDRQLGLHLRYLNPLAVVAGTSPVYEWRTNSSFQRPPLTNDDLDPPTGTAPVDWACANATGCAEFRDPITSEPPMLLAQRRSCASGQAWASCEDGLCTPHPVSGLLHLREAGDIVGTGLAQPDGSFCAVHSSGSADLEITRGSDYPRGSYLHGSFEPDRSVPVTAACPDPTDPNWPVGDCQDLGIVELACHPEIAGGECMDADFTVHITHLGGRDYQIQTDASNTVGANQFKWEVLLGFANTDRFIVTPTSTTPTFSFDAHGYGTYSVRLLVTNDAFTHWDVASRTVTLHDEAHVPTSRLWVGPLDPDHYAWFTVTCEDDDDCRAGQSCLSDKCSWPCVLDEDCPLNYECNSAQCRLGHVEFDPLFIPLSVEVPEFWIGRTEVTQAQYMACTRAGACSEPTGCGDAWDPLRLSNHPVVCTTWDQASAYCEWRGQRLPTEFEWEAAARGAYEAGGVLCGGEIGFSFADQNDVYPWGNTSDNSCGQANARLFGPPAVTPAIELLKACDEHSDCNSDELCLDELCTVAACAEQTDCPEGMLCAEERCVDADYVSCVGRLVPVGSHPDGAAPSGALDMAGNAAEWVADTYQENHYAVLFLEEICGGSADCTFQVSSDPTWIQSPEGPVSGTERVVRGGSADADEDESLRAYTRDHRAPSHRSPFLGFRCAISSQDILDCDYGDCTFDDCNQNGRPDECDVRTTSQDCNANHVPDSCDLDDGIATDANHDGILDVCDRRRCPVGLVFDETPDGIEYCSGWEIPGGDLPTAANPRVVLLNPSMGGTTAILTGGGVDEGVNEAFVFDKDEVTLTAVAPMSVARARHTMSPIGDDQAIVVGGLDQHGNLLASAEIYDRATDQWTLTPPMPSARYDHVAVALSTDRVMVLGGRNASGERLYDGVIYTNHAGGQWTDAFAADSGLTELPMNVNAAIPIGWDGALASGLDDSMNGRVLVYDSFDGTWMETTPPPEPGTLGVPLPVPDSEWIFFIGGRDESDLPSPRTLAYRTSVDLWLENYPDMADGRFQGGVAYLEQYTWELLVAGGAGDDSNLVEVYRFNPAPTGWRATTPMNYGHWGDVQAVSTHQRNPVQVLVVGGFAAEGSDVASPPEVYTRTWAAQ